MSKPIHLIVESRQDYIDRQNREARFILSIIWWMIIGGIIGFVVVGSFFPTNLTLQMNVFYVYLAVFFLATYVLQGKMKVYAKLIIAGTYALIGLLFVASTLYGIAYGKILPDSIIWFVGIIALFFFLAYHNVKKYTNLIDWFKEKIKSIKSGKKHKKESSKKEHREHKEHKKKHKHKKHKKHHKHKKHKHKKHRKHHKKKRR